MLPVSDHLQKDGYLGLLRRLLHARGGFSGAAAVHCLHAAQGMVARVTTRACSFGERIKMDKAFCLPYERDRI